MMMRANDHVLNGVAEPQRRAAAGDDRPHDGGAGQGADHGAAAAAEGCRRRSTTAAMILAQADPDVVFPEDSRENWYTPAMPTKAPPQRVDGDPRQRHVDPAQTCRRLVGPRPRTRAGRTPRSAASRPAVSPARSPADPPAEVRQQRVREPLAARHRLHHGGQPVGNRRQRRADGGLLGHDLGHAQEHGHRAQGNNEGHDAEVADQRRRWKSPHRQP